MNWHFANNYYHFLIELLPKCILNNAKIYYPISTRKPSFISEYCELFGLDENKILTYKSSEENQNTKYQIPKREELEIFKSILPYDENKNYPEKIYISRKKCKRRRLINEEQLLNDINLYGFKILELEDIPVIEQIQYFYNAKIIIGVHGAGLTNLIYCKPFTTIIELKRNEKIDPVDKNFIDYNNCYKHLSQILNLNYKEVYLPIRDDGSLIAHRPLLYSKKKIEIKTAPNIASYEKQ